MSILTKTTLRNLARRIAAELTNSDRRWVVGELGADQFRLYVKGSVLLHDSVLITLLPNDRLEVRAGRGPRYLFECPADDLRAVAAAANFGHSPDNYGIRFELRSRRPY